MQYSVTVDTAGTLLLLIDNRVGDDDYTDPPTLGGGMMDWVAADGYVATPYTISNGADGIFTAYAKSVTAGTYTLNEQFDGTGRMTYLVAGVPDGFNVAPSVSGVPASASVAPGEDLVIDATVTDMFGDNTATSVVWTKTAGGDVTFAPDVNAEDVTVSFPGGEGDYTLTMTITDGNGLSTVKTVEVAVEVPKFAIECTNWVSVANDDMDAGGKASVTFREKKSVHYVRNLDVRRRVAFIEYDISSLKEEGKVFANTFLTINKDKGGGSGNLFIYGIKEDFDNEDLNSTNWNKVPGLVNDADPTLPISVDTLELSEITPALMELTSGELVTDQFVDTSTSAAFDALLNDDNDGHILIMLVTFLAEGSTDSSYEISSPTNGNGADPDTGVPGVALRGNVIEPYWATNPSPAAGSTVTEGLPELSWDNPAAVGTITSDVYIGIGDPNEDLTTDNDYVLIADDITETSVLFADVTNYSLEAGNTYTWIVLTTDSGKVGDPVRGPEWDFNVVANVAPAVSMETPMQYVWLNNSGDPSYAQVVIKGIVEDMGPQTLLWEQTDGPSAITIDPSNVDEITLNLYDTGTYVFKLTSTDNEGLSGNASAEIIVSENSCDAAQMMPGYVAIAADLDNDCDVDLNDFAAFAAEWLECNSLDCN